MVKCTNQNFSPIKLLFHKMICVLLILASIALEQNFGKYKAVDNNLNNNPHNHQF